MRALLIEDEPETVAHVAEGLAAAGWAVEVASDGGRGYELARLGDFDVLVVDRMLPQLDGLALVKKLRAGQVATPALFVTAMGAIADRVDGLEGGGDDYLVKPFSFAELQARVNALVRRAQTQPRERTQLQVRNLVLDRLARTVRRGEREIELLPLEFKLMEFLLMHVGQLVTRTMLLEQVWGFHFDPRTNIVETHISRIRGKIDEPGEPALIATVRGAGYLVAGE
ncbi:winged helix-turn-helix domain-containing protein [Phenylobacterium montanum]|uniref:Response regulator transcription factor n=1 Tax=Phenylobacterium montanum TaxID=2823693 RepID=A0A975IUQ2_9CAUL|nr:response regulator transcription factor [Caulobacter sp. S6]QUD88023.1 response regulator transcription factor [Caulobacter sp. S6]